ncbi:MAG TPA: 2-hydroxyacid dehydrogenase [Synergistales bacterium]|nr:2-hydroxyacid dehydrogenase [Synergistales bacterium]
MSSERILVTSEVEQGTRQVIREVLEPVASVHFLQDKGDRAVELSQATVLMSFFFNREVGKEEYGLLNDTKLLQTISTGVDYLPFQDIPHHISIACNAGGWAYQIAEHAVAMAMALYKRLVPNHNSLVAGDFNRESFLLRNLKGKTLGVIGFGGIGKYTAQIMRGMDVRVMALNTRGTTEEEVDFIGTLEEMPFLLKEADIVLLSIPLTRNTVGLIGKKELEMMKRDAMIINVARAPLMEERALYEHLRDNPEFLAALDVWWEEPSWSDSSFSINFPFFELPNFIGSPHNSNYVEGSFEEASRIAAENVRRFLVEGRLKGRINREDYL